MEQQLSTTSILSLFETNKEQRQSFVMGVVDSLEEGMADPLKVHLQIKCLEDIIKLLNTNSNYKNIVLSAAEKYGKKTFEYQQSKIEIKEMGAKYSFDNCGDCQWEQLSAEFEAIKAKLKVREDFLKTVPVKGLQILNEQTGELETIYPPTKTSTTSVSVTLK